MSKMIHELLKLEILICKAKLISRHLKKSFKLIYFFLHKSEIFKLDSLIAELYLCEFRRLQLR